MKVRQRYSPTSNETLTCNCITDQNSDMLNSPISEDEVKKAVKRLKNGKACGEDKILNEMIKAFSESHMGVLTKIFNIVLPSGHMPHEWVIVNGRMTNASSSDTAYSSKAFSESHISVLTKIFNIVLQSGHMSHEWVIVNGRMTNASSSNTTFRIGIIKPIYKNKG